MKQYRYRNPDAQTVLIQLVGEHDLPFMEQEIKKIKALTDNADLYMIAVKVNDWNNDLSPWAAPPVFGKEPFGDGAKATLDYLQHIELCRQKHIPWRLLACRIVRFVGSVSDGCV